MRGSSGRQPLATSGDHRGGPNRGPQAWLFCDSHLLLISQGDCPLLHSLLESFSRKRLYAYKMSKYSSMISENIRKKGVIPKKPLRELVRLNSTTQKFYSVKSYWTSNFSHGIIFCSLLCWFQGPEHSFSRKCLAPPRSSIFPKVGFKDTKKNLLF